jgi:phenylalanyl-tRNA synthetase beta chain
MIISFFKKILGNKKPTSKFPKVVVGQIIDITNHPKADRLQVATVNIGRPLKVVCGATNIAVGQLVPVALIGACLPNGIVIQQVNIRGIDSEGMICAEDELCIGQDHTGIIVLTEGKIGEPIDSFLKSTNSN